MHYFKLTRLQLAFKRTLATNVVQKLPLFNKILIANRGEIACRIMRTAKKLGIKTVAVYSDPDRNSMHSNMADESWHIGEAASSSSYLKMDKIIQVAKSSGAQAIHPGYGFLSENAAFAEKCKQEGLVFIGPPAQAIIDMGSKSASKQIMIKANVPVVPGYHGSNQDPAFLKSECDKMGYPVLIKAIKGGGGKGMRIVEKAEDFDIMLESSKREARKSFGDDTVLVEKYLTVPRHVEVQVFADTHGNAVYLFERDCSVQRRHQKILEEAPAPGLTAELRKDLGEKAVAAAKAVGYVGAGTVEFILDTIDNKFYFMEMNTRLQVEHPVTEMVTGADLVEWQLEVASGNYLPKFQNQLKLDGHAFEARIYAEKPENNFLPDVGPLIHMRPPSPTPTLRIESGVKQGDQVTVHYDPMICKLVVKGTDRNDALRKLRKALEEFEIVGLSTNIAFLKTLASHPSFIAADVETGFIKKHFDELFKAIPADPNMIAQAALGVTLQDTLRHKTDTSSNSLDPWSSLSAWRLNHTKQKSISFLIPSMKSNDADNKEIVKVYIEYCSEVDTYNVTVIDHTGTETVLTGVRVLNEVGGNDMIVEMNGKKSKSTVVTHDNNVYVFNSGNKLALELEIPGFLLTSSSASHTGDIITPMPCKISQVMVKAGDSVNVGQPLIILEAMKMEHVIRSPTKGIVKKILFKEGDIVGEKKKLLIME